MILNFDKAVRCCECDDDRAMDCFMAHAAAVVEVERNTREIVVCDQGVLEGDAVGERLDEQSEFVAHIKQKTHEELRNIGCALTASQFEQNIMKIRG